MLLVRPMAGGAADGRAIEAAARRAGTKLMIAYRLHFEPATLEAIRIEQSGVLGRVWLFSSVFTQVVARSNHRASHGYWAGPVPDMGTYPINAVRNLFRAEPTEVMAWGVKHEHLGFNFDDTVTVMLRFPGGRLGQFTVAYGLDSVSEYRVCGDKGNLLLRKGFAFPGPITHELTVGGSTSTRSFGPLDQFGAETQYFSDCVLHDRDPEPDAEEGRLDVRVLAAVEQALLTGKPQELAPYHRAKHPVPGQGVELAAISPPPMVNAYEPSEG